MAFNPATPYFLYHNASNVAPGYEYFATEAEMLAKAELRVADYNTTNRRDFIPLVVGGLITQANGNLTYHKIDIPAKTAAWRMTQDDAAGIISASDGDTWGTQRLDFMYAPTSTTPTIRLTMPANNRGLGSEFKMTTFTGSNGLEGAKLSYKCRFKDDFDFVKGGKMPGLYGGDGNTGSDIPDGTDGFSARIHWNEFGFLTVYAYLPYDHNVTYGKHFFPGIFTFTQGVWHLIELELIMNTPGVADGVMRVWGDGTLIGELTNVHYRDVSSLQINGFFFSGFFGGGDATYNSTQEEWIDYNEITMIYSGTFQTIPILSTTKVLPPTESYEELEQHCDYNIWKSYIDSWRFAYSPDVTAPTIQMRLPANEIQKGGEARPTWFPGDGLERGVMTYKVRFRTGFDFSLGGKLPGMYAGIGNAGGNIPDGTDGWTTRLMWNANGYVTVYAYLPYRHNVTYGWHFFLGNFAFTPGIWHTVVQENVMNTPTIGDGIIRLWVDGFLVGEQTDIIFRDISGLGIKGPTISTFRGGGDLTYASAQDDYIDYHGFEISY